MSDLKRVTCGWRLPNDHRKTCRAYAAVEFVVPTNYGHRIEGRCDLHVGEPPACFTKQGTICDKCGGHGNIPRWSTIERGRCFDCDGRGYIE
jgi:hypothetical protein